MDLPDPASEPDRDAFDQLVAKHHGAIGRLVFRLLGWRDGGEDVVQEVFLSAWAAWSRFPKAGNAEFWLKRIAVNKCRSRLRRQAVRARWFGWLRTLPPEQPQAVSENSLEKEECASRVRRAIQSLKPPYREVTVLHYLEQMNVDEIAQVVGGRKNTIEVRLHRARQQLEKLLADLIE
jgi:RNA polymerase sigma factor CnrH